MSDTFDGHGNTVESWVFDDAATAESPDNTGSITYAADGSGSGTVTSNLLGGTSQTCDVAIAAGGAQTISNCR